MANNEDAIVKNLEAIKKLLIQDLLVKGVTSEDIGKTIGLDGSTIRHMVKLGKAKKNGK